MIHIGDSVAVPHDHRETVALELKTTPWKDGTSWVSMSADTFAAMSREA